MPWIESHQKLEKHPKLLDLCEKTGWSKDEAIGKLHRLWWWVLDYAEDGNLSKWTPVQILGDLNGEIDPEKLYNILKETKFIDENNKIHDWYDFAGNYLHAKYHNSNPLKLKKIQKMYKDNQRITKGQKKDAYLPTLPTYLNLPTYTLRANTLKSSILKNDPKAKITPKQIENWTDEVRLMVEMDGRTLEEIDQIIEFTQNDPFEKANVLSIGKLRKRFTQLLLKLKAVQQKENRGRESNICPTCHRPMADQGAEWFCSDCKTKYKKSV